MYDTSKGFGNKVLSYTAPLCIYWKKRSLEPHDAKKKRVCRHINLNYFSFNFILSLYFSVAV